MDQACHDASGQRWVILTSTNCAQQGPSAPIAMCPIIFARACGNAALLRQARALLWAR